MADYPHLGPDGAGVDAADRLLTVALSDGTVRHYPGDYEARPLDGQWLAIYRPRESAMSEFAVPVAGFRLIRVESFTYSGHEVYPVTDHGSGRLVGTVHDPLSLLDDPLDAIVEEDR